MLTSPLRIAALSLLALAATLAACGGGGAPAPTETPAETPANGQDATPFTLESAAFEPGGTIPVRHTCDGENLSPALSWRDPPGTTRAYALIMDDPDAPGGTFTHWVLYNVPATASTLLEAMAGVALFDDGSLQGPNDAGGTGYTGPCPPPGDPHRYVFTLTALDSVLDLAPGASKSDLLAAMEGHVLGEATLTGTFGR